MATTEELFGATPAAGKAAGPSTVSTDDLFGTKSSAAAPTPSLADRAGTMIKETGKNLGAVTDMVLGLPGQVLGVGADIATRAHGLATGKDRALVAKDAIIANNAMNEIFGAPVQKVMNLFGKGEDYSASDVNSAMEKLSTWIDQGADAVERNTGGVLKKEDAISLVNTTMTALGVAGVRHTMGRKAPGTDVKANAKTRFKNKEGVIVDEPTVDPVAAAREAGPQVAASQTINELLGIKTGKERAAYTAKRRKDVQAAFKEGEGYNAAETELPDGTVRTTGSGMEYADYLKHLADERQQLETSYREAQALREIEADAAASRYEVGSAAREAPELTSSDVLRILRKPGFERTLMENMALRRHLAKEDSASRIDKRLGKIDEEVKAGMIDLIPDEHLKPEFRKNAGTAAAVGAGLGAAALLADGDLTDTLGTGTIGAMAVLAKPKGGMWHPEAVQRLADPINTRLITEQQRAALVDGFSIGSPEFEAALSKIHNESWGTRAIRNYLNKHAGTATDPLEGVQIPFGEGTKGWDEVMASLVKGRKFTDAELKGEPPETGIRPNETVWSVEKPGGWSRQETINADHAIQSYLSHVGDYLSQNVDPAKLGQYDLVRAVKETAANDARVAKEMEKSRGASTAQLPVYKDYGDGYKWVELKLPEKLTPEQAKGVRPESFESWMQTVGAGVRDYSPAQQRALYETHIKEGAVTYEAVDAKGKPIKNSYTEENATGRTPEEAWLAGRLAEEGNTLGHCVGGYCDAVASGESRILSLRDAKGESHVTVEVMPPNPEMPPAPGGGRYLHARGHSPDPRILQIKGKQNRAPAERYLPYVQDFVKSGKWGEVGDLGNTGLHDLQQSKANSAPFREMAEELFPGQRYLTAAERESLNQEGITRTLADRNKQSGFVDPRLLGKLAAIGGGAILGSILDDNSPLRGMLAGAGIAGLAGSKTLRTKVGKGVGEVAHLADVGLGNLSTRMGNISPALKFRARNFERRLLKGTHDAIAGGDKFLRRLNKLPAEAQTALKRAMLTGDAAETARLIARTGDKELAAGWTSIRGVLDGLSEKLEGLGRYKKGGKEYFPRLVKDREGLANALGGELKTGMEKALQEAEDLAVKRTGHGLSDVEASKIINQFLRGHPEGSPQAGIFKKRKVGDITEALEPFYASPAESFHSYVRSAVGDLERARFFGKNAKNVTKGGQTYEDIKGSIGAIVKEEMDAGRMTGKQAQEFTRMLDARFGEGERSPHRYAQLARNTANTMLLGNPASAAVQLTDMVSSLYSQGLRPTLEALVQKVTGKQKFSMKDFGLADHISEEFVNTARSAKVLNSVFKWSGFSAADALGKTTVINAAFNKFSRMANSGLGQKAIARKYGAAFPGEMDALIADLKAKRPSERVQALIFNELSDLQPISKIEMPEAYLRMPNGRLMYMLKSFMLKQADIVRRDAYNKLKTPGQRAQGLANLTKYGLALGVAGTSAEALRDWINGRPVDLTPSDIPMNMLKTFGWSEYVRDQATGEGMFKWEGARPVQAAVTAMAPPYRLMDDIIRQDPKAVQYIPFFGKLYYNHAMGGNLTPEQRKEKKKEQARQDRILGK